MSRSSLRSFWLLVTVHVAVWVAVVLTVWESDARGYLIPSDLMCGVLLYAEAVLLLAAAVLWPTSHWSIRAILFVLATAAFRLLDWDPILHIPWHTVVSYLLVVVTVSTPLVAVRWSGCQVQPWKSDELPSRPTPWQFSIRQLLIWTAVVAILLGTRFVAMEPAVIAIITTVWVGCLIGLRPNKQWWRLPVFFVPWIAVVGWYVVHPIGIVAPWAGVVLMYAGPVAIAWLLLNVVWIRSLGYRLIRNTSVVPSPETEHC